MGLKDLLLQKGWGYTISRAETIDRLNPLIKQHNALMHYYNNAIARHSAPDVVETLEALQKTTRGDIGKLCETVFSAGGIAYNGTDLEPEAFVLVGDDQEILLHLQDLEETYQEALEAESDLEHQMRTRAILTVIKDNSKKRISFLQSKTYRR